MTVIVSVMTERGSKALRVTVPRTLRTSVSITRIEMGLEEFDALRSAVYTTGLHRKFPEFDKMWAVVDSAPDFMASLEILTGEWVFEDQDLEALAQLPERVEDYEDEDTRPRKTKKGRRG